MSAFRSAVERYRAEHREEHGVARHLQAELDGLLTSDRQQPCHRASTYPLRGRTGVLAKPAADGDDEQDDAGGRRLHQQRASFGRELQVVVVRLGVVLREIVALIEERGDAVRVEAGADERIAARDRGGVFPRALAVVELTPAGA